MKRILVIEDDKDIQEMLQFFLEDNGYKTTMANNGVDGIAKFHERDYSLVLLDIMLPKIDGYAVCELLRKESNIPIIIITALTSEEHQIKGLDLKADDYITKPFSMPILLRKIDAVLRRSGNSETVPSFKITIRGEAEMNYRIENREAFRIIGVKLESTWTPEKQEAFTEVPKFWAEHRQKGTIPQLCKLMNSQPMGVLGVSVGDWQQESKFNYYIAVSSTQPVPEGMYEYQIPACTWAIFECKGPMPTAIQKMQERIMTEWFPGSGYEYANAPDIEVYADGDQSSEDYICWIWVPVKK